MDNIVDDTQDDELSAAPASEAMDATGAAKSTEKGDVPEDRRKLVARIIGTIKSDKKFHDKAFKNMHRDMFIAMHGREETWNEKSYKANISGRHVKQKTASLYAKNPKATAKRTERLDFAVWDEDPQTLMLAVQTVKQATEMQAQFAQMQAAVPPATAPIDPLTAPAAADPAMAPPGAPADPMLGHNGGPPLEQPMAPPMPPGFEEAQATLEDFQQGMQRRKLYDKVGRTLEILFARALRELKPVDFKTGAKQLVRRVCTTSVGYAELGFQRKYGPRPGMTEKMADAKARLDHMRALSEDARDGEIESSDAEMAELQLSMEALQSEPEILIREGLIVDFPPSTKVIPDQMCKKLVGFIGARHLTIEYEFTDEEVRELFDVDLGKDYTGYTPTGDKAGGEDQADLFDGDDSKPNNKASKLCRVWKYYDKPSGLVYYVADGYPNFLREPAPPDVFVEDFWPVYALTFNDVENEKELFPPSDVALLLDMQREHNRARQGRREHREAARPRWAYANGQIEEDDVKRLTEVKPFEAIGLNVDPQTKISDILQSIPVPGVDPNLYETEGFMQDAQLAVGAQQAQLGGVSKATATESAIAEGSSASADNSGVDDLDAFLTVLARSAGQILLKEMSEEQVKLIVGPGAVWPSMTLDEIAEEIYLEVEAGSTGKPNQAVEINNWKQIAPVLLQVPGLNPVWFLKETLRRLDDRMDVTDAVAAGIPAIVAQNRNAQPAAADANASPDQQGHNGGNNGPQAPGGPTGSDAAFGSNQV
jgi:hypothetical protein